MHESMRRQYLALLGVELWLPRDAVDATVAPPVPDNAVPAGPLPAVAPPDPAAPAAGVLPEEVRATPENTVTNVATLSETPIPAALSVTATAPVVTAPSPPVDGRESAPEQPPVPGTLSASASGADAMGCSLLALPDGLLLLATYLTPRAPGLSGPEHALLASIAAALAPAASLPAPDEFRWPPSGVRLPAVARPGAGIDALVGLLAEQRRKRGLRDLLVLGESLAPVLDGIGARLGLCVVFAPSLAAMLADPALKRACWEVAKPLRRGGA